MAVITNKLECNTAEIIESEWIMKLDNNGNIIEKLDAIFFTLRWELDPKWPSREEIDKEMEQSRLYRQKWKKNGLLIRGE